MRTEPVLHIDVVVDNENKRKFLKPDGSGISTIPFEATADGPYFTGTVLPGGVDTQRIFPDGRRELSARYILEGTDCAGNPCHIFVENNGVLHPREDGSTYFAAVPTMVTDSPVLNFLEQDVFVCDVVVRPQGPDITVLRVLGA